MIPKLQNNTDVPAQKQLVFSTVVCFGGMMPELEKYLTGFMSDKSNIYCLVNDGSSDTGLKKMNVACTMIFYINRSKTVELEWDEIASLVPTRWLCLERCCQKGTKKFEALVSMFQSRTDESSKQDGGNEDDDKKTLATRFRRLKNDYKDP